MVGFWWLCYGWWVFGGRLRFVGGRFCGGYGMDGGLWGVFGGGWW